MHPVVSFVIATHNRGEVVIETLAGIRAAGLAPNQYEIIVVDSASTDDTPQRLARQADVRLLALRANVGSVAKAYGVDLARGEYVVFLDDDSFPQPGSIERMLNYFDEQPQLGAAGFRVVLPNGVEECCGWPDVPVGCGVGFRRAALIEAGGLDRTFFMQAEEYDLTFRLTQCGWDVRVLPDLWVLHQKTPVARVSERTTRLDVRNNLRVLARYLPDHALNPYLEDCLQRYSWLAQRAGREDIIAAGVAEARQVMWWERQRYAAWRMTAENFERHFQWQRLAHISRDLRARGVQKIALAGLGKNLYAYWLAAETNSLSITSLIADDFADGQRKYRQIPVTTLVENLANPAQAVLIADSSFVRAAAWSNRLRDQGVSQIINLTSMPGEGEKILAPTAENNAVFGTAS